MRKRLRVTHFNGRKLVHIYVFKHLKGEQIKFRFKHVDVDGWSTWRLRKNVYLEGVISHQELDKFFYPEMMKTFEKEIES